MILYHYYKTNKQKKKDKKSSLEDMNIQNSELL